MNKAIHTDVHAVYHSPDIATPRAPDGYIVVDIITDISETGKKLSQRHLSVLYGNPHMVLERLKKDGRLVKDDGTALNDVEITELKGSSSRYFSLLVDMTVESTAFLTKADFERLLWTMHMLTESAQRIQMDNILPESDNTYRYKIAQHLVPNDSTTIHLSESGAFEHWIRRNEGEFGFLYASLWDIMVRLPDELRQPMILQEVNFISVPPEGNSTSSVEQ